MSGPTNITGFWTSQTQIEQYLGRYAADALSNMNNQVAGPDPNGFSDAIGSAEAFVNRELMLFGYPSGVSNPAFPKTSVSYSLLSRDVTVLAAAWLYGKRGMFDETNKIAGAFAAAEQSAMKEIKQVIRDRIPDVARGVKVAPASVMNPVAFPLGSGQAAANVVQAPYVPTVP